MDGLLWNDGSPYLGANAGIDPGQMGYWNDGAPFVNIYEPIQTDNILKASKVNWSNIGKILGVLKANIGKLMEVDTSV